MTGRRSWFAANERQNEGASTTSLADQFSRFKKHWEKHLMKDAIRKIIEDAGYSFQDRFEYDADGIVLTTTVGGEEKGNVVNSMFFWKDLSYSDGYSYKYDNIFVHYSTTLEWLLEGMNKIPPDLQ